jgi:hypothetical protein
MGCSPNRLRAYMFADKKSQSPEVAPSGVRQDIFVAFITYLRYSRGSLTTDGQLQGVVGEAIMLTTWGC